MELKDREHVEGVEAEIDGLIERGAQAAKTDEKRRESVERYLAKRRQENQAAWYAHERHMERLHLDLAEEHHQKAMKLLEGPER